MPVCLQLGLIRQRWIWEADCGDLSPSASSWRPPPQAAPDCPRCPVATNVLPNLSSSACASYHVSPNSNPGPADLNLPCLPGWCQAGSMKSLFSWPTPLLQATLSTNCLIYFLDFSACNVLPDPSSCLRF